MMAQIGVSTAPARPVMTATTAPPTVVVATGSPTESGNIRAFEGQVAAFNAHDLAAVDSFNDPSAVFHMMTDPQDGDAKSNTAALGEFFKAFPDCRLAVEGIWAAGDYVVARLTFTGTNTAASRAMGIAKPTGRSVTVHVFEIGKFANGKLVEDWVIFDGMAFAGQLGLLGS
jgi:predicted ester cyclase